MSNWSSGDIISNGIRIRYHRTGGDKPTLLIAHGVTDNALSWSRFARSMEQDYDVILYDRRGHGFSDKPESGYTFRDHAEDMAGLTMALGLDHPHIRECRNHPWRGPVTGGVRQQRSGYQRH